MTRATLPTAFIALYPAPVSVRHPTPARGQFRFQMSEDKAIAAAMTG
jgi:hypothetical protein